MNLGVIFVVLQLIYLEGILSLDNAAVLAVMVSHLPRDEAIPWPRLLRFLRKPANRVLDGQRQAALKVGLLGAYLGRGLMLLLASAIIHNRWLLLIGAVYLIKVATDALGETPQETISSVGPLGVSGRQMERSFWSVVLAVELADLAFSLDNVVAAVALSRQIWVVLSGVGLGILLMRVAAGFYGLLLQRYPILGTVAYLLVLNIALELLLEEVLHVHLTDAQKFTVSLGTLLGSILYSRSRALQHVGRHLAWLKRVLGFINVLLGSPVKLVISLLAVVLTLFRAFALVLVSRQRRADPKRRGR